MEKLQQALQKAREQRDVRPLTLENPEMEHLPVPTGATGLDALWAALTGFAPDTRRLEKNRIVSAHAQQSGTPFDILRTKILLAMRKNGWTRIAITSPTEGCGKTTTACNLAFGCARNADIRTILYEFDLRRPGIAKLLKLPNSPGISSMLTGEVRFEDLAVRCGKNLAVAAAHKPSDDPTSILLSKATHRTLQKVDDLYKPDLTIFDLPPLLVSDDTRAVLKDVDCAIMVVKANTTTMAQIDTCEREIAEHTNMLGIVLNQCRDKDDAQG